MTKNYPDNVKWLDEIAYFDPENLSGKPCRRMRVHEARAGSTVVKIDSAKQYLKL